jgi:uncharacterized protein YneF (UPF0154 family)
MRKMIILIIIMAFLFIGLLYISYQVMEKEQEDGRYYNYDDRF